MFASKPLRCRKVTVKLVTSGGFNGKYQTANNPARVEHINGTMYGVTVWWDNPKQDKYGHPEEFPILIKPDGTTRPLKILETKILQRDIPQRQWRTPESLKSWARQDHSSSDVVLHNIFADLLADWNECLYCPLRVSVEKNGSFAVFRVPPDKLSYFFKDRDYALTPSGVRKRILHVVKPFQRTDGTWSPLHFRGEKQFTWAGYNVSITVSGKDHPVFEELDVGMYSLEPTDPIPMGMIGAAATGRKIRQWISGVSA